MSIGLPPTPEGDPPLKPGQLAALDPARTRGHPVQVRGREGDQGPSQTEEAGIEKRIAEEQLCEGREQV